MKHSRCPPPPAPGWAPAPGRGARGEAGARSPPRPTERAGTGTGQLPVQRGQHRARPEAAPPAGPRAPGAPTARAAPAGRHGGHRRLRGLLGEESGATGTGGRLRGAAGPRATGGGGLLPASRPQAAAHPPKWGTAEPGVRAAPLAPAGAGSPGWGCSVSPPSQTHPPTGPGSGSSRGPGAGEGARAGVAAWAGGALRVVGGTRPRQLCQRRGSRAPGPSAGRRYGGGGRRLGGAGGGGGAGSRRGVLREGGECTIPGPLWLQAAGQARGLAKRDAPAPLPCSVPPPWACSTAGPVAGAGARERRELRAGTPSRAGAAPSRAWRPVGILSPFSSLLGRAGSPQLARAPSSIPASSGA